MLDVVSEQYRGHLTIEWRIRHGGQEVRHDQIDSTCGQSARDLAAQRRHSSLVEIDRERRQPRSQQGQSESAAAPLRENPWVRHDLASRQRGHEPPRILTETVGGYQRDLVPP